MDPIRISKRHLIALVSASAVCTLVVGWFVGVYFFDGSGLNYGARSKADLVWHNTMVGEYDSSSLQEELLAAGKERLGGELSTVSYEGVDGGKVFTSKRMGITLQIPARVRMTNGIEGNPGIPLVIDELSATEIVLNEAARELAPRELVGSADRSILPTFIEVDRSHIVRQGLRVEVVSVAPNELVQGISQRFAGCQVSGVEQIPQEGSSIAILEPVYIAAEGCDLTFQPFLRYHTARKILIVAYTGSGCRFPEPSSTEVVTEKCLDYDILQSLTVVE